MAIDLNDIRQTQTDINDIRKGQQRSDLIMVGVIVVLFVGFMGVSVALGVDVADSYRAREATYQQLADKIQQQSTNIQQITAALARLGIK